jgi:hypothetical protein
MEEARLNLSCEEMIVYQLWEDVNLKSVVEAGVILGLCQVGSFLGRKDARAGEFQKKGALGRNRRCLLKNIVCDCVWEKGQMGRLKYNTRKRINFVGR